MPATKFVKTEIAIERGKRLKFVREMTGMSMRSFACYCNVGLTTINYWEQAFSCLTERGAQKIVQALRGEGIECTTLWLMQGIGAVPKIADQSKLSKLNYATILAKKAPEIREQLPSYIPEDLKKEIDFFKTLYPQGMVCSVSDDSMAPLYNKQDFVAGKRLMGNNMELGHEMDCIVELEDTQEFVVRRIKVGSASKTFSLYVINPDLSIEFPPQINIRIRSLAPIARIWRPSKL